MFYIRFFYWKNEQIAHFLFFGERCEWIAQVAHQKWAMWANPSGRSPKMRNHEWLAQVAQRKWAIMSESLRSLTKNERMSESLIFGQKNCDSLGKPMCEFPALSLSHPYLFFSEELYHKPTVTIRFPFSVFATVWYCIQAIGESDDWARKNAPGVDLLYILSKTIAEVDTGTFFAPYHAAVFVFSESQ